MYFRIYWKSFFMLHVRIQVKSETKVVLRMGTVGVGRLRVCNVCSPCWLLSGWRLVTNCAGLMKSDAVLNQIVSQCVLSATRP